MAIIDIDEAKLEAFVGHVATEIGAAVNAALALIGDELGLYRAMADGQPVSPAELPPAPAPRSATCASGSTPRPPAASSSYGEAGYVLPPEHALVLADETSPFAMTARSTAPTRRCGARARRRALRHRRRPRLARAPPRPLPRRRAGVRRRLPHLPRGGVAAGARRRRRAARGRRLAADVGCGHGASTILMAQAFPAARFVGIDYHAESIARRARARRRGGRRRPRDVRGRGRGRDPGLRLRPRRVLRRVPRPRRPARRGAQRRLRARPGRRAACSSSRSRATGWRTTCTRSAASTTHVDARVHARVALAARPRRARHAGGRGALREVLQAAASARSAAPPRRR